MTMSWSRSYLSRLEARDEEAPPPCSSKRKASSVGAPIATS